MADPVSSLKHITQMALKIKEAVDTVRRNKEDCLQIRRRVVRVSDILSQLQETGNIMSNPAMSAALEDLSETLRHAHTLVVSCQEKNVVCLLCAATALSKKLRRVNDDISDQMMVGIFVTTVHATIALSRIQGDAQHDVMYALPPTEITEVILPKKEEPQPPPPPMEAEAEPEPEEPIPLLSLRRPFLALEEEPTSPPPTEKPEATLVLECHPSPEEEPTPPLSPQLGEVRAQDSDLHYRITRHQRSRRGKKYACSSYRVPVGTGGLYCSPFSLFCVRISTCSMPSASSMASSRPISETFHRKSAKQSSLPVGIPQKLPDVRERELMKYSFLELKIATHNFATKIGQGGFASVYKGVLGDGVEVAIKKHTDGFPSRYEELPKKHPLIILRSMLEHKNIVQLLGYCQEYMDVKIPKENATEGTVPAKEEFLLLVEEYMTNGNLGNLICGGLDWSTRLRIIEGITQGVVYLHTHSEKPIVHLDLKPDNILLDSNMNPKIGDFGLSKELQDDETNASVRGTLGYMPPEYIVEGIISLKNDVYGFGVTLLEIICGMSESGRGARHQASIKWAWNVRLCGGMNKLFDPSLCDESQLKEIKRCMEIGLLCTQNKPTERPTMQDVLKMIQGKKKVPTPKQPGYIKRGRVVGAI